MKLRNLVPLVFALSIQMTAHGHDAWIEPQSGQYAVLWGHGVEKIGPYKIDKVKSLTAIDAHGKKLKVSQKNLDESVKFKVSGKPSVLMLTFESGFYTKTTDGHKSLPKNEVPNAVSSNYSTKYGKTIVAWSGMVEKAQGQKLEIIPQVRKMPREGESLPVLILFDGKPLSGVKVNTGAAHADDKAKLPETDSKGVANVSVAKGRNTLSVSNKIPSGGNPQYDFRSYSANLIFDVK
jgi:nickel transport protein